MIYYRKKKYNHKRNKLLILIKNKYKVYKYWKKLLEIYFKIYIK